MYSPIYSLYFLFLIQLVIRNENKLTNPSPALSLLKQAAYWMMYPTNISNTTDNGWITLSNFCHQVSGSSKAGCQPTYKNILLHQKKQKQKKHAHSRFTVQIPIQSVRCTWKLQCDFEKLGSHRNVVFFISKSTLCSCFGIEYLQKITTEDTVVIQVADICVMRLW